MIVSTSSAKVDVPDDVKIMLGNAIVSRDYRAFNNIMTNNDIDIPNMHFGLSDKLKDLNALMFAAKHSSYIIIDELLDKYGFKDRMEEKDDCENTALFYACHSGSVQTVRILVEKGANLHARGYENTTPFMMAFRSCNVNLIRYLLEENSSLIDDVDSRGWNGVMHMCRNPKHYSSTKILSILDYISENFPNALNHRYTDSINKSTISYKGRTLYTGPVYGFDYDSDKNILLATSGQRLFQIFFKQ